MYVGSGKDFIAERNNIQRNFIRLEEILGGHILDQDETQEFADQVEDWEFEDYFE